MLKPGLMGLSQDTPAERDQLAAYIAVIDRAAVILGIDGRDDAGEKIGQIFRAAYMF